MSHASRGKQGGQSAVFTLVLLGAILMGLALLYNTGRLSLTKTRLQNTADSAAYSGSVLLARDYNFSAYANRGMVANQVAIAQMVGLRSWAQYECNTYHDSGCGNNPGTYGLPSQISSTVSSSEAGSIWGTVLSAYATSSSALNTAIRPTTAVVADVANTIDVALSTASRAFHVAVVADLASSAAHPGSGIIGEVIQANDPQAQISTFGRAALAADAAAIGGFTKTAATAGDTQGKNRIAPTVLHELDAFSQSRSASDTPYEASLVNPFAFIPYNDQPYAMIWNTHSGGTAWKDGFTQWSAMDVSDVYGFSIFWVSLFGVPVPLTLPIWDTSPPLYFDPTELALGGATVGSAQGDPLGLNNNDGPCGGTAPCTAPSGWNWNTATWANPGNENQAFGGAYTNDPTPASDEDAQGPGPSFAHYSGLQPYETVSNTAQANFDAPAITVVLARAQPSVHTTSQINGSGIFSGSIVMADAEPSNQVEAIASADAHFERPWSSAAENNLGVSVVYGNLFNPYWEPHLVPTDTATKAAAQAAQFAGHG